MDSIAPGTAEALGRFANLLHFINKGLTLKVLFPNLMLRNPLLCASIAALSFAVSAQQPLGLEPIPEPPPPPPGVATDLSEVPVRITPGANEQIEELVIDGKPVIKVTTPSGAIYYLRDDLGQSPGGRRDSLDQGIRVPLWVIQEF